MLERIRPGEATPMDLDIMASVQDQHHRQLPVRARRRDGDAGRLDDREVPRRVRGATWRHARGELALEAQGRRLMPRPEPRDDHVHDRRPRGDRAREHDARRRRQARRRRDPGLLLRAQARPAGRRLPHVPGRDRGHPEAADRLLDAGQGRHGRPHADRRACKEAAERRSSSSCSINHPLDCPVCDKGGECPLQDISFGWGGGMLALHRAQAPLREAARALAARSRSTASAASSATAACASARRSPRTTSWSCSSAARTRTSARSTAIRTSRRSAATSSSCARWAR